MNELGYVIGQMSPSKLDMLQRCGFAFFCRYVEGIRTPPTAALAFGSAFDDAANDGAATKIVTRETPPPDDVAQRFDAAWTTRRETVEDWGEDDPGAMLDVGTKLAGRWTSRFLSQIRPVEVQPRLSVDLETNGEPWQAVGFGDVDAVLELPGPLHGSRVVVDNKTSAKRWTPDRLQTSTQSAFYVEALARKTGDPIERAVWAISVRGGKRPDVQVLSRRVDLEERRGILNRFAAGRELVRALYTSGAWLPNRSNVLCSRRWCGYWGRCERTWGGTVKA